MNTIYSTGLIQTLTLFLIMLFKAVLPGPGYNPKSHIAFNCQIHFSYFYSETIDLIQY